MNDKRPINTFRRILKDLVETSKGDLQRSEKSGEKDEYIEGQTNAAIHIAALFDEYFPDSE